MGGAGAGVTGWCSGTARASQFVTAAAAAMTMAAASDCCISFRLRMIRCCFFSTAASGAAAGTGASVGGGGTGDCCGFCSSPTAVRPARGRRTRVVGGATGLARAFLGAGAVSVIHGKFWSV